MRQPYTVIILVAALLFAGCSSSKPFNFDREKYPTVQEMKKETSAPAPDVDVIDDDTVFVASWTLLGPFPNQTDSMPSAPTNALERSIAANAPDNYKTTKSAQCVAREVGHFYANNQKFPHTTLDNYIVSTCGSTAGFGFSTMDFNPAEQTAEEAIASLTFDGAKLPKSEKPVDFAVWGGVNADSTKGVIVFAYGTNPVNVESFSLVPDTNGYVTIQGELLDSATNVFGSITKGDFEAEDCANLPGFEVPRFKIRCKVNAADEVAHYEISAGVTGSDIQSNIKLQGMVFPNKADRTVWTAPKTFIDANELPPNATMDDVRKELVRMANEVRAKANAKPLKFEAAQSSEADAAYPHYLAAKREDRIKDSDFFVRGLSAGWRVDTEFVSSTWRGHCEDSGAPEQVMSDLLTSPSGRETLLNGDVTNLAIGLYRPEKSTGFCSMYLGYKALPDESHEERVKRFLKALNRAREANGKSRAKIYKSLKPVAADFAKDITKGELTPEEGMEEFVDKVAKKWRGPVTYIYGTYTNLERVPLDGHLVAADDMRGSIMVAPYKHPGYPMTVYVVVFVYKGKLKK